MNWRLARSWACYWIMEVIGAVTRPFPRSRTKTRIVNALCRPFFGYGGYYALRRNPNTRDIVKRLEKGERATPSTKDDRNV